METYSEKATKLNAMVPSGDSLFASNNSTASDVSESITQLEQLLRDNKPCLNSTF